MHMPFHGVDHFALVKISATDAGCFADRDFCDFPPGHPRVHDESDEFFTFSKILTFIRSFSVIDFRTSVCKNFFSSSRSLYHIWPSFDTDYFCHVIYISRSQLLEQATFGLCDLKF